MKAILRVFEEGVSVETWVRLRKNEFQRTWWCEVRLQVTHNKSLKAEYCAAREVEKDWLA